MICRLYLLWGLTDISYVFYKLYNLFFSLNPAQIISPSPKIILHINSHSTHNSSMCPYKGLILKMSALKLWPIYSINSVDKTKLPRLEIMFTTFAMAGLYQRPSNFTFLVALCHIHKKLILIYFFRMFSIKNYFSSAWMMMTIRNSSMLTIVAHFNKLCLAHSLTVWLSNKSQY